MLFSLLFSFKHRRLKLWKRRLAFSQGRVVTFYPLPSHQFSSLQHTTCTLTISNGGKDSLRSSLNGNKLLPEHPLIAVWLAVELVFITDFNTIHASWPSVMVVELVFVPDWMETFHVHPSQRYSSLQHTKCIRPSIMVVELVFLPDWMGKIYFQPKFWIAVWSCWLTIELVFIQDWLETFHFRPSHRLQSSG